MRGFALARSWEQVRGRLTAESRTAGVALIDQMVVSLTNFLTGVFIGRACSKDEFGLYLLGLSILLVGMRLQTSLISTPYMVYFPRMNDPERRRLSGSSLIHHFGVSLSVMLFLLTCYLLVSLGWGPTSLRSLFAALILSCLFVLFREFLRRVFFATLNFRNALILDILASFFQILGLIILTISNQVSAAGALFVIGLASFLPAILIFSKSRQQFQICRKYVFLDFLRNWSFGKWIFGSSLLWEFSTNFYPWILAIFHGTSETGVWAACFGVVSIGNPVLVGMQNYVAPKLAHLYGFGGQSLLKRSVPKYTIIFILIVAPMAFLFVMFGSLLPVLFYGKEYSGQGVVIALLGLDLPVTTIRFTFSRAIFAMGRADLDFFINVIPVVILVTVGIPIVSALGVSGVAGVLLGNNIVVTAFKIGVFHYLVRQDFTRAPHAVE